MIIRLLADPTGSAFFGVSLWKVPSAHLYRYRLCRKVAIRIAAGE